MSWSDAQHVSTAIKQAADRVSAQFSSPHETDRNGENANVVDALFAIARAISDLAEAVREHNA